MNKRILALLFLFTLIFTGIGFKAFFEQIIMGPYYAQKALSSRTINFPGEEYERGDILDCNGISLTDTRVETNVVVFPKLIENPKEILEKFKNELPEIDIDLKDIKPYYRNNKKIYPDSFNIRTNEEEVIDIINSWEEKGVLALPVKIRYGVNSIATNIVGCLGYKGKAMYQKGILGIEEKWENKLKGDKPERLVSPIMDARGNILNGLGYRDIPLGKDPKRADVMLTIDSRIQRIVEEVMDEYKVSKGGICVLNVENGEILAAASRPRLNQNNPTNYNQIERVIDYKVYPGSVFKVITAAAALEEGIVTPKTMFHCDGTSTLSHVGCPRPHGDLSFTDAMKRSCNITFVKVGLQLGREKLKDYIIDRFGVECVPNKELNSKNACANGIIGQEIFKTSPLEMANIMATIARNGYHQQIEDPWNTRLVKAVKTNKGLEEIKHAPIFKRIYGDKTAKSLRKMLEETNKNGSGKRAWIKDVGSAGKTGTPQTDKKDEFLAWYVGYAPLNNPKWAIAVLIEEKDNLSKSNLQGGRHAGPIFKDIIDKIILHLSPILDK